MEDLEPCERDWIASKRGSTRKYYPTYWAAFKEWLEPQGVEGYTGRAEEIRRLRADDMLLRHDDPARWRFEDLAKKYYVSLYGDTDLGLPTGTDRAKLTVVQSFFRFHRMGLVFKLDDIEESVSKRAYYEYSMADLEAVKEHGSLDAKWVFLGGKSLGQRIGRFLALRREQVEPLLEEEPPVPIDIQTTKKVVVAHPCLDRDAVEAARVLLVSHDSPWVLPGKGGNRPMTEQGVGKIIRATADLCHGADPRTFRHRERGERLRFHNLRKFLNSALQNAHVDRDLRNWIIGHKLTSTEAAYTTHERAKAYEDAAQYLLLPRRIDLEERRKLKEEIERTYGARLRQLGMDVKRLREERHPAEVAAEQARKETRIIDEQEAENHLNHGWNFVSGLPSGKILVERESLEA